MQETGEPQEIENGQDQTSSTNVGRFVALGVVALFVGFAVWFLVFQIEWGGGSSLPLGTSFKGRTLIVSIEKMNRVSEVRYRGTDNSHVLVTPTDPLNELVTLQMNVHNDEATVVILNMQDRAVELRGVNSNDRYNMLDVRPTNTQNVRVVEEAHPSVEDRYSKGFLIGPIELPQGNSLEGGWVVFEVPKGLEVNEVRWGAGDIIFIGS